MRNTLNSLVILSKKESWGSVEKLKSQFLGLEIFQKSEIFQISYNLKEDLLKFQRQVDSKKISQVVIFDETVQLVYLLNLLELGKMLEVKICQFIFGNPLGFIKKQDLALSLNFLEKFKLKFLVGSKANMEILENILNKASDAVYIPYFIEPSNSKIKIDKKNERERIGFEEDDIIFLYTGRISYQKNVHSLVNIFHDFFLENKKAKLLIVGKGDDLYSRLYPKGVYLNYSMALFSKAFFEANKKIKKIYYKPWVNAEELKKLYFLCDHYISLSTFQEEDFGVSASEALAYGMPCILTRWGGHKEFESLPQVSLIPLEKSKNLNLNLNLNQKIYCKNISEEERSINKSNYNKWLRMRVNCISKNLLTLNDLKFSGFNEKFIKNIHIDYQVYYENEDLSPYWT